MTMKSAPTSDRFRIVPFLALGSMLCFGLIDNQVHAQDRFVPVSEGTLDTETGITWGYALPAASEWMGYVSTGYTWDFALTLWIGRETFVDEFGEEVTIEVFYPAFSALYSGEEMHDDWRLPTRDEMVAAYNAGLFEVHELIPDQPGSTVFNIGSNGEYWSATPGGKKRGGFDSGYTVNIKTGEVNQRTVGSILHAFPVRGVDPPVDDSKGNGGGKGNSK